MKPEVELVYRSPFANNEIPDNENSHGIIQEQAQVNTTNILNNPSNFEEQIKKTRKSFEDERGGYIVLLVLLLPIFLSGGMLIDLLISEKEKKTGEALLALPIKREKIFYSKFLSIMIIIVFQLLFGLWLFTILDE